MIDELYKVIVSRKKNSPKNSYVGSLFQSGTDRIIQKVGEEAVEVVIAAKNKKKDEIISEVADLLFHVLILLAAFEITPKEIFSELQKRRK